MWLILAFLIPLVHSQGDPRQNPKFFIDNQRFYYLNNQQPRYLSSYQNQDNQFFAQPNTPFRPSNTQNVPQSFASQNQGFPGQVLGRDLQTSDLPPHLAQTLPQYTFNGFPSPTVPNRQPQHQNTFEVKPSVQTSYLFESGTQEGNRPQSFHNREKQIAPSTYKPPHSHYILTHNSPQTETFLGQITLQSPEFPEIKPFRPNDLPKITTNYNPKWQDTPKVVPAVRSRYGNNTFKDFNEAVDQNLDDKTQNSAENNRKPSSPHPDRPVSNSVNSVRSYFRKEKPARVVNNPETSLRSRGHINPYVVNHDVGITTARGSFRPKLTSTTPLPIIKESSNRFAAPKNKPTYPRQITNSGTGKDLFDIEKLLEDPIENNESYNNKDDVEVIPGNSSTEKESSALDDVTTERIDEVEDQERQSSDFSGEKTSLEIEFSHTRQNLTATTEKYDHEEVTTEADEGTTEIYYEYEYEDETSTPEKDEEENDHPSLDQHLHAVTETSISSELTEQTPTETPEHISSTEDSFDILTMKPSSMTVEDDNFNTFVDSALIDNTTEEHIPKTTDSTLIQKPENSITVKPVLIGGAVVSVVTTKSVVNGTYSTPAVEQTTKAISNHSSADGWVIVGSVQTSRSVSGGRYFNLGEENISDTKEVEVEETLETTTEVNIKPGSSSTESIIDKLDRVQSELSSGLLSGDFKEGNNIAIINEMSSEETTTSTTTEKVTTSPSPVPTGPPVVIRKFSPSNRPTQKPRRPFIPKSVTHPDDLASLLPPGYKEKYQSKSTTETPKADTEVPQGDEPQKSIPNETNQKLVVQTAAETNDPVKTLESFLTKIRNQAGHQNKSKESKLLESAKPIDVSAFLPPGYKAPAEVTTTPETKASTDSIFSKAEPVDISAFLPPGYKPPEEEKKKNTTNFLLNTKPVDVSAFLPPGYKPPKNSEEPITKSKEPDTKKNISSLLADAKPVDISSFLPSGFKQNQTNSTKKNVSDLLANAKPVDLSSFLPPGFKPDKFSTVPSTTEKKGVNQLFAEAEEQDISKFLPPGYSGFKPRFTKKPLSTTEGSTEPSSPIYVESTSASSPSPAFSTTASNFKVVFPSRPGGRKPIARITTPKSSEGGAGVQTAPTIQKGWPTRATTEFTGWPTPSTTPISIEKLLEAARTATSLTAHTEDEVSTSSTTTSTTTTTTTTPRPTTPGICNGECNVGGVIKLVGGAKWIPELLDRNTKEWQILANEVEEQLEKVYSKSSLLNRWYKKVTVDDFSPGSIVVDYSVELTDLGRQVNTLELKRLFNEALQPAPVAAAASGRSLEFSDIKEANGKNITTLSLGNFILDPMYTDFIVLAKPIVPTVGYADENPFLPQWAIAVIVIGLASLLFVIIFGVTVLVNRQKNAKKKAPTPLTEEMLNELNKNHMGGLDNYGADDLYNMEDVWNDKTYDMKPQKKQRSSGSIHENSMSNLYDSWRSEWNGYYYNAYYGNPGSSNSGYTRRRSDYDTNF